MKGVLEADYYQHYALLVGGIILLSGRSISPKELEMAGKFLIHFVQMFDAYYGMQWYFGVRSRQIRLISSSRLKTMNYW